MKYKKQQNLVPGPDKVGRFGIFLYGGAFVPRGRSSQIIIDGIKITSQNFCAYQNPLHLHPTKTILPESTNKNPGYHFPSGYQTSNYNRWWAILLHIKLKITHQHRTIPTSRNKVLPTKMYAAPTAALSIITNICAYCLININTPIFIYKKKGFILKQILLNAFEKPFFAS